MTKKILKKGKICAPDELLTITPGENNEKLVDVRSYDPRIIAQYEKFDMFPYTGKTILVRDVVAQKLASANTVLLKKKNCRLKVVYGYRHPKVQKKYFNKKRNELKIANPLLNNQELDALTHNFVALPEVAGHPTGGAVDITILDS